MNCVETRAALPGLLYGDVPFEQAAAMRDHLAACLACREEEAALRRIGRLLNAAPVPATRVDVARLYQEASRRQQQRLRRWRRVALACSAAAATLLLIMGLRLELRVEAHQMVLRWSTPPERPDAPGPQPVPRQVTVNPEDVHLVQRLIHALADDVAARDRETQETFEGLEARVDALQRQAQDRWDATQRFVSTLSTLSISNLDKKE